MTNTLLQAFIASLIGSIILINTTPMNVEDITRSATLAVNGVNIHQLATALEVYYSDQGNYPKVADASAMIDELYTKEYIRNKPLDSAAFEYAARDNGQDYSLKLAANQ